MNNKGFTLIEILVGILIFSFVIIGGFQTLTSVNIGKIKLTEQTNILKESNYFIEKLFEEIKKGGTIDFEEYFNRKVIGVETSSGYYNTKTGFGNFGSGGNVLSNNYGDSFYYCRSGIGVSMGTGGCYNTSFNIYGNSLGNNQQRYGQYFFQFIDYNSNMNNESFYCSSSYGGLGDEDCNLNIRGDDDDEHLGLGPVVFTGGQNVKELYLISGDGKKRTFFRWSWKRDKKAPISEPCNSITFGTGCIGTVEFLKLDGKDWGYNHSKSGTGNNDGVIDTWIINPDFSGGGEVVAGSNNNDYRLPLFPDTLSVKNFDVYLYPNFDGKHMWKEASSDVNPYVRLKLTLTPSWEKRGGMRGDLPEIDISTTINLASYFSN